MRSRNIKPGFFVNPDLIKLDGITRLLFIGLWTLADREGLLEDHPEKIKLQIFPGDDVDVDKKLDGLATFGFINRYQVEQDGNIFKGIHIVNFLKHQRPHHKEKQSKLPHPIEINKTRELQGKNGKSLPDSLNLIPDSLNLIPEFISEDNESNSTSSVYDTYDPCPHNQIIELYHECLPNNPKVIIWHKKRRYLLTYLWREDKERQQLNWWRQFFQRVANSKFLTGQSSSNPFRPGLEWLLKPSNFLKVLEGNYDHHEYNQCIEHSEYTYTEAQAKVLGFQVLGANE